MQAERTCVLLGLGSNLGDRRENIRRGLDLLAARDDAEVVLVSRLIETAPVGGPPQGRYLNGAAEVATTLDPMGLLSVLGEIERTLGRVRTVPNGPRELDLDILLFGERTVRRDGLVIPHPRMLERAFVLEVAAEIAPARVHPETGRTLSEHWRMLGGAPPCRGPQKGEPR